MFTIMRVLPIEKQYRPWNINVKPCNIIFARHLLMSCKQQQAQSLDDYLQKLKQLAKDCNY